MLGFGKQRCEYCGTEIKNDAYLKDGKKFHSKDCADNLRRASAKHDCCH